MDYAVFKLNNSLLKLYMTYFQGHYCFTHEEDSTQYSTLSSKLTEKEQILDIIDCTTVWTLLYLEATLKQLNNN